MNRFLDKIKMLNTGQIELQLHCIVMCFGNPGCMADHVIRLGVYKCFVIVGVRMTTLLAKKDLTVSLEDFEPITILRWRYRMEPKWSAD
jgi:hypothetical protein